MSSEWQPFGLSGSEQDTYAVLVDGVPTWLLEPLVEWIKERLAYDNSYAKTSKCLVAQNVCRVDLGAHGGEILTKMPEVLGRARGLKALELLRLADFLVSEQGSGATARALDAILTQARSKWTVGDRLGKRGLVERVPSGVQISVEGVIDRAGVAGRQLGTAWSYAHGLNPEASPAFANAVKAVETAAIALVMPKKADATLGNVIGQMTADGNWTPPFRPHADYPPAQVILGMLQTLWRGHRDRHGSADYSDVTLEEAKAAVSLAATLVDWFAAGVIARREPFDSTNWLRP